MSARTRKQPPRGQVAVPQTREERAVADEARMRTYIKAVKEREERQAELDWRLTRALDGTYDGPMLGELLGGFADVATRIGAPNPLERGTDLRGPLDRR